MPCVVVVNCDASHTGFLCVHLNVYLYRVLAGEHSSKCDKGDSTP